MSAKYSLLACILFGCFYVSAFPQDTKRETFWVGVTLEDIKERSIKSPWTKNGSGELYHYLLKDGFMMACFRPTPVFGVLLRGGKCYIFDVGNLPDKIGKIPLKHGDKIFRYRNRAEVEALKLPILEGTDAATTLLALEAIYIKDAATNKPNK